MKAQGKSGVCYGLKMSVLLCNTDGIVRYFWQAGMGSEVVTLSELY